MKSGTIIIHQCFSHQSLKAKASLSGKIRIKQIRMCGHPLDFTIPVPHSRTFIKNIFPIYITNRHMYYIKKLVILVFFQNISKKVNENKKECVNSNRSARHLPYRITNKYEIYFWFSYWPLGQNLHKILEYMINHLPTPLRTDILSK